MTIITNLPNDLVEEILSRVPVTSLGKIRPTCKKFNTLSKDESFTEKHLAHASSVSTREGECLAIVTVNLSLYMMRFNLRGIENNSDPSLSLVSLKNSAEMKITRVFHCEGLVLCTWEDYTRLVVWNPYSGQTRWIYPDFISIYYKHMYFSHALGYVKSESCRSYKVLRFFRIMFEIYELDSSSWRVLDAPLGNADLNVQFNNFGLSLKGNTYWFATDPELGEGPRNFLLCFDYTTEKFGQRLPLPFVTYCGDAVYLSSVREEQLVVFYQDCQSCDIEVWVTTKIEPNAVSWSKFLVASPRTLISFHDIGSFLLDEERRAVVVLGKDKSFSTRDVAYIIGENEYYREVHLGEATADRDCFPLACSYVPSSVPINQPAGEPWPIDFAFHVL